MLLNIRSRDREPCAGRSANAGKGCKLIVVAEQFRLCRRKHAQRDAIKRSRVGKERMHKTKQITPARAQNVVPSPAICGLCGGGWAALIASANAAHAKRHHSGGACC